jgi:hypothetical protein
MEREARERPDLAPVLKEGDEGQARGGSRRADHEDGQEDKAAFASAVVGVVGRPGRGREPGGIGHGDGVAAGRERMQEDRGTGGIRVEALGLQEEDAVFFLGPCAFGREDARHHFPHHPVHVTRHGEPEAEESAQPDKGDAESAAHQTFSSRCSRSQGLMTWRNSSYSVRFTVS